MRPEKEPLRRPARAVPDLDAEREVDFGRYVRAVAARWWLVLLGVVVGVLVGCLLSSATSSNVHRAQATIYLGQPIAALGSAQLPSPATNIAAVREIVRSDEHVDEPGDGGRGPLGRVGGHLHDHRPRPVAGADGRPRDEPPRDGRRRAYVRLRRREDPGLRGEAARDRARARVAGRAHRQPAAERLLARSQRRRAHHRRQPHRLRRGPALPARRRPLRYPARADAGPRHREGRGDYRGEVVAGYAPLEPELHDRRRPHRPRRRDRARARLGAARPAPAPARLDPLAMYDGKTVAVVVPAYNEEALVASTVAGVPAFVDRVIVVDDGSGDETAQRAAAADPRVEVVGHERNEGVGAAIVTGYRRAVSEEVEVTCVMAADGQMDPDDLETLVRAVASGECDYAKANRLFTGQAWRLIPRTRYLGNAALSFLTKIASGYWHVADSQSGYTAVSLETLKMLDLDRIYRRYGFPNDILVHLNVWNRRVQDFPSRPIYGVGERSGIRLRKVVPRISWLLLKGFFWRMGQKYVIRDFHPLILFYMLGLLLLIAGFLLGLVEVGLRIAGNAIPFATIVLVALLVISGLQLLLFAM